MRKAIVKKLQNMMAQLRLEAVVTSSPENFGYLVGFVVPTQALIRHRHAMAILTADGVESLFGVDMEASTIARRGPAPPLPVWREFHDDPMEILAATLTAGGLTKASIGLEMDYLPAGDFARLQRLLPAARFVGVEKEVRGRRQIKTPEEVELIHKLSRSAAQAICDSLPPGK